MMRGLLRPAGTARPVDGGEVAMVYLTGILALGLAATHLLADRAPISRMVPRSPALSLAGGVAVAFIFVHVLPELSAGQRRIERADAPELVEAVRHHVYLLALLGLVVFYGLERAAVVARRGDGERWRTGGESSGRRMFAIHVGAFGVYNALIGYLLVHHDVGGTHARVWFFVAMALHLFVNDHALREHHRRLYHRVGRWLLSAAVLVGWAVGIATPLPDAAVAVIFAVVSGGVILNVLKEELPPERESRFWPFAIGVIVTAALLLIL